VAVHPETTGHQQRIFNPTHFHGIAGMARPVNVAMAPLRPLASMSGWREEAGHERRSREPARLLTRLKLAATRD
jgi:hypothetical protein